MEEKRQYGNWALVSIAILLVCMGVAVSQYKVPVILGDIMSRMGMDASTGSWLMSIFTFVGIVLALPTGSLAKRFGPKTMMLAAAVIVAVGAFIGALAGNGTVLIVSRAIEGVAFIFVSICGPLAVQKYVAPEKRGTANGIWALYVCLGSVIGGVATPSLYAAAGFVGVWVIYALLAVVCGVICAVAVKFPGGEPASEPAIATPQDAVQPQSQPERKAGYADLFKPNTLLFYVAFLAFNMCLLTILSFSPTFLQQNGADSTLSGFISTLPMLLALVSSPLIGSFSDKLGRAKPFYLAAMVVVGPCALLMLTQTGPLLWVAAVVMGLVGMGGPGMCMAAYASVLERPELMSIGMGMLMLVQSLGQFLATLVVPMLLGADMNAWVFAGVVVCVIGFVGAAALAACKCK